jgi:hypothetical protein
MHQATDTLLPAGARHGPRTRDVYPVLKLASACVADVGGGVNDGVVALHSTSQRSRIGEIAGAGFHAQTVKHLRVRSGTPQRRNVDAGVS